MQEHGWNQARAVRSLRLAPLALLICVTTSCVGDIEPGPPRPASGTMTPGEAQPPPERTLLRGLAAPTLHRLRVDEVRNALSDLLGTTLETELEPDTTLKGFTSIGASALTIANTTAEKLEAVALESTTSVFADAARRRALVGCTPAHVGDDCAQAFLVRFGRRAFRRPLAPDEHAQMSALAERLEQMLGDVWQALSYTTSAFLQAPQFVFRVEHGELDPEGIAPLRYDGYEMASRLSFLLWRSIPDDALLDAADAGELTTRAGVARQARRLMAAPRFRSALRRFFSEQLALDRIDALTKDPAVYAGFGAALRRSMRADLELRFDELVFERDGDYRELLDGRTVFVDAPLAKLYGLPDVRGSTPQKVTLPERSPRLGILASAGMMALHATPSDTSPTRRGKFVRTQILCEEVPPPPPGTDLDFAELDSTRTMRERLEAHGRAPACAGCHAAVDPIGLAFEHFDGVGAYRKDDHGLPLDVHGSLDGEPFDGPAALATLLREHPGTARCVTRQLYRFALGHQESREAQPQLDALAEAFRASAYRLPALMLALVTSDAFRYAALPSDAELLEGT